MKRTILFLFALCGIGYAQAQTDKGLVINEIMQSNVEYIMDDLKEFPDSWVELYNASDQSINLKDYAIHNKNKPSKAWPLPDMTIDAKGYVVIYCDKEEYKLHTDFRLESVKGGNLYLFKGETLIDKLESLSAMPAPDVSYGRKTDGADEWGYQLTPSAGAANTGAICDANHILGAPVFSEPGRVTSGKGKISLELSLPENAPKEAVIRYTTDGSEPTVSSKEYTGTINISKTTVIRAKVFCDGWLSPLSTAQSYIYHPRKMTIPVFSVQTNDKYLNDKKIGLFANNNSKDDRINHDWRRPVNIEFFPTEGEVSIFNQPSETRIQGGQSRSNALKSMVFYANRRFDTKHDRFLYEFFPDQKPGVKVFKSFSLRDGGNDFGDLYFRDAIIQRTMGSHVDLDWQACHSAVLYINGEYMGMLNIRERSNADNIFSNYDGLEEIDMIEISHEKEGSKDMFIEELKEGTDDYYEAFKTFYSEEGHTKAEYEQWMDVSEYLNIMVMNLFYGNIDFPGNNIVFWRPNDKAIDTALPKRWRFIVKDTDFGLGLYGRPNNYNTLELIYNPSKDRDQAWACTEPATRLFRNMMENEDLRQLFIDKCCVYMGDFMNAKGTGEIMDLIKDEAMEEFIAHRDKYNSGWGGWWGKPDNRAEINNKFKDAKAWVTDRPKHFYKILGDHYELGTAIPLTVNKSAEHASIITMNGIELSEPVFDGKFFPNRQLTLSAIAPESMTVKGWRVVTTPKSGDAETKEYTGSELSLMMPSCKSVAIEAILSDLTGISQVATDHQWKCRRTTGGICVSSVPEGLKVSLYDLRGVMVAEAVSNGSDIILPAANQLYLLRVGSETVKIR